MRHIKQHMLIVIAGPQGCGKSHMATIIQEAFEEDQQAGFIPSTTTLKIEELQVQVGETITVAKKERK